MFSSEFPDLSFPVPDTFICPTRVKQLSDLGRTRIRPGSDSCLTRVGQILLLGGADSTRLYLTGSSEKLSANVIDKRRLIEIDPAGDKLSILYYMSGRAFPEARRICGSIRIHLGRTLHPKTGRLVRASGRAM
jgi:hypothetical protein